MGMGMCVPQLCTNFGTSIKLKNNRAMDKTKLKAIAEKHLDKMRHGSFRGGLNYFIEKGTINGTFLDALNDMVVECVGETSNDASALPIPYVRANALIKALAKWNDKYSKVRIYSINFKDVMDMINELDELAEQAKELSQHLSQPHVSSSLPFDFWFNEFNNRYPDEVKEIMSSQK